KARQRIHDLYHQATVPPAVRPAARPAVPPTGEATAPRVRTGAQRLRHWLADTVGKTAQNGRVTRADVRRANATAYKAEPFRGFSWADWRLMLVKMLEPITGGVLGYLVISPLPGIPNTFGGLVGRLVVAVALLAASWHVFDGLERRLDVYGYVSNRMPNPPGRRGWPLGRAAGGNWVVLGRLGVRTARLERHLLEFLANGDPSASVAELRLANADSRAALAETVADSLIVALRALRTPPLWRELRPRAGDPLRAERKAAELAWQSLQGETAQLAQLVLVLLATDRRALVSSAARLHSAASAARAGSRRAGRLQRRFELLELLVQLFDALGRPDRLRRLTASDRAVAGMDREQLGSHVMAALERSRVDRLAYLEGPLAALLLAEERRADPDADNAQRLHAERRLAGLATEVRDERAQQFDVEPLVAAWLALGERLRRMQGGVLAETSALQSASSAATTPDARAVIGRDLAAYRQHARTLRLLHTIAHTVDTIELRPEWRATNRPEGSGRGFADDLQWSWHRLRDHLQQRRLARHEVASDTDLDGGPALISGRDATEVERIAIESQLPADPAAGDVVLTPEALAELGGIDVAELEAADCPGMCGSNGLGTDVRGAGGPLDFVSYADARTRWLHADTATIIAIRARLALPARRKWLRHELAELNRHGRTHGELPPLPDLTPLLRVAMLTREYDPEVYGGAGVHVDELVRALRQLAHVDVHCCGNPRSAADVHAYQPTRKSPGENAAIQFFRLDLQMAKAVGRSSPPVHVGHSHTWYTNMAGELAKRREGIPHVITSHSLEPLRPWKAEQLGAEGYQQSLWMERTAYRNADAIIAVSNGMRADVLAAYPELDPDRVHVVHNGIDTDFYRPIDVDPRVLRAHGIDPTRPIVLFIGRITRQKGIDH
ncbi:MAG: glycosyl transferase family 1, partial [Pseudonocardia sp.]|nr:glycosyl transferase family 1 [Pseudonocardia sp.]